MYISAGRKEEETHREWFRNCLVGLKKYLEEEDIPYQSAAGGGLVVAYDKKGPAFIVYISSNPGVDVLFRIIYPVSVSEGALPFVALYALNENFNSFAPELKYDRLKNEIYVSFLISKESIETSDDPGFEIYKSIVVSVDLAMEHYESLNRYCRADLNGEEKQKYAAMLNEALKMIHHDARDGLSNSADEKQAKEKSEKERLNDSLKRDGFCAKPNPSGSKPTITIPAFLLKNSES